MSIDYNEVWAEGEQAFEKELNGEAVNTEETDSTEAEPTEVNSEEANADSEQTKNDDDSRLNSRLASARRDGERRAREAQDSFFRSKGYKDFEDFKRQTEQAELETKLNDDPNNLGFTGLDAKPQIESVVRAMPEIANLLNQAQAEKEQLQMQKEEVALKNAVSEISKIDNSIKSVSDLMEMDNAEEFNRLVIEQGVDMVDAFKLVNLDKLIGEKENIARQNAINKVNSKSHMKTISGNATDDDPIPDDQLRVYLDYGITEDEAREHWKNRNK